MIHPTCDCGSEMILIEDINRGQAFVYACMHCDMPQEEEGFYIYQNHCWNCGYGIDSRFSQISQLPGMGYICGYCGKDLTEWKIRKGLITMAELLTLKGAYKCYSTATSVLKSPGIQ